MKPMLFLAETGRRKTIDVLKREGIGRMFAGGFRSLYDGEQWGFDNGAFSAYTQNKPFPEDEYRRRLDRLVDFPDPHLAVCPDIVRGGPVSLEFSIQWMEELIDYPIPWYLAVQRGMRFDDIAAVSRDFSGIFIGGNTPFAMIPQLQTLGLPVHVGRCGTRERLRAAMRYGVDSLDSSTPIQNPQKLEQFIAFWKHGDPQTDLFL